MTLLNFPLSPAKIEVLTDNLEQHRKETLHAISRARDKSLSSTTAVDKLQTVIERMNEKFSDITRLIEYVDT